MARFAPNMECGEGFLRSVPKSKLMAGPTMSGLRRITAGEKIARFAHFDGVCPGGAFGASRFASYRSGLRCMWRFRPCDCSGRGPVWGRGRFVVGQI